MKKAGKQAKQEKKSDGDVAIPQKPKGRSRKDALNTTAPEATTSKIQPPPLDCSLPVVLTDGTTELCRRSSRKKTMKFDIKEVLNIKTTPKIQIVDRMETKGVPHHPPVPRRISIGSQPSTSASNPKSIIQAFVSTSSPPPASVSTTPLKKRPISKSAKKQEEPQDNDLPIECTNILNDFMELIEEKPESNVKRRSIRLKTTCGSPFDEKRLLTCEDKNMTNESSSDLSVPELIKKTRGKKLVSQTSVDSIKSEDSVATPSPIVSDCSTDLGSEVTVSTSPAVETRAKKQKSSPVFEIKHNLTDEDPVFEKKVDNKIKEFSSPKIISRRETMMPINSPDFEKTSIESSKEPTFERLTRRRATMFKSPCAGTTSDGSKTPENEDLTKNQSSNSDLDKTRSKTPIQNVIQSSRKTKTPVPVIDTLDNPNPEICMSKRRSKTPSVGIKENESSQEALEIKNKIGDLCKTSQNIEEVNENESKKSSDIKSNTSVDSSKLDLSITSSDIDSSEKQKDILDNEIKSKTPTLVSNQTRSKAHFDTSQCTVSLTETKSSEECVPTKQTRSKSPIFVSPTTESPSRKSRRKTIAIDYADNKKSNISENKRSKTPILQSSESEEHSIEISKPKEIENKGKTLSSASPKQDSTERKTRRKTIAIDSPGIKKISNEASESRKRGKSPVVNSVSNVDSIESKRKPVAVDSGCKKSNNEGCENKNRSRSPVFNSASNINSKENRRKTIVIDSPGNKNSSNEAADFKNRSESPVFDSVSNLDSQESKRKPVAMDSVGTSKSNNEAFKNKIQSNSVIDNKSLNIMENENSNKDKRRSKTPINHSESNKNSPKVKTPKFAELESVGVKGTSTEILSSNDKESSEDQQLLDSLNCIFAENETQVSVEDFIKVPKKRGRPKLNISEVIEDENVAKLELPDEKKLQSSKESPLPSTPKDKKSSKDTSRSSKTLKCSSNDEETKSKVIKDEILSDEQNFQSTSDETKLKGSPLSSTPKDRKSKEETSSKSNQKSSSKDSSRSSKTLKCSSKDLKSPKSSKDLTKTFSKDELKEISKDESIKIEKTELEITKTSQKMKSFQDIKISEDLAKSLMAIKTNELPTKNNLKVSKIEETSKPEETQVKSKEIITELEEFKIKSSVKKEVPKQNEETSVSEEIQVTIENLEEIKTELGEPQKKKSSVKKVIQKQDLSKNKLKKSLEKGAEILQKVVESVKNKKKILKRKKNSDIQIIRRRDSLPNLSKADKKLQLKAIREAALQQSIKESPISKSNIPETESPKNFESDSAIKLKNGLKKAILDEESSFEETSPLPNELLENKSSEEQDENAVDMLLESFQVKAGKEKKFKDKKESIKKKKPEKTSDPLDDIEKFIAISENLLSKPENKENKDILVKKLFNDIKEFEANVKQENLAPPRRSNRLQTISKSVSKSSKGVVRNEKYSMEEYKLDLAELEAENARFLKDMEERLTQFTVIKKNEYKCERIISKEAERMVCDCYLTPEEEDSGAFGCGEDCLNRLLMIECGDDCVIANRCTNRRFQNFMYSHCKVFRTEKKGFGIMADADILPGDFIMEYVGEVIDTEQFEERREEYSKDKNAHYYFMALRSDSIIDATTRGNISRFINHSCEPNAETQKWTVNGELRIGFFCIKKILPGEEITFDYQFQRYGREAQKCYCESENCRGWIGEEPDSEDDEELEEEEEEEEVTQESDVEEEVKPVEEPKIPDIVSVIEELKEPELPKPVPPPLEVTPMLDEVFPTPVAVEPIPVPPPPISEVPVEPEPAIVKPKVPKKIKRKPQVLEDYDIIENVESLIQTGLKNQAQTLKLSRLMVRSKLLLTRIKILQIIQNGELPCKRLFLDYHGLRFLHEWMVEIKEMDDELDIYHLKMSFLNTLDSLPICNKTVLKESGVLEVVESWSGSSTQTSPTDDDSNESTEPTEKTVFAKVQKMLEKWKDLQEVFKIPKKERIEQMKEHEREADRAFKILNIPEPENMNWNNHRFNKLDFRKRSAQYFQRTNTISGWWRMSDPRRKDMQIDKPLDNVSKEQRRREFAQKVQRDENEKRLAEENRMIEVRCRVFGLDPKTVDKNSLPYCFNNTTLEWYAKNKRKIDIPPSCAALIPPKKMKSTNPTDYKLPKMNLPPDWKFAIDGFGRCYYYNKRSRVSQWHQPITLKPSGDNSFIKLPASSIIKDESDDEGGSDISGDENELWLASKNPINLKEYINAKVERRRNKRNNFLVKERAISPRKEEDRLHNQIEMRKYKETKEKLRRRKERRRKSASAEQSSAVSQISIPDYLLSSDDEDFVDHSQQLNACPLIDKIVEDDKLVDEIEFIEKHKPLKRHLSGGSRDKYGHRNKRPKVEGYKRESSGSSRSSSSKYKFGNTELSKKAKEKFRSDIGLFIMQNLIHYRKPTCPLGRITSNEDFDHLTRKLTQYIYTKESKHCGMYLEATDSVKNKTREYIKKYMAKYGDVYVKPSGDHEFKEIPNIKILLSLLEEYQRVENFDIFNA